MGYIPYLENVFASLNCVKLFDVHRRRTWLQTVCLRAYTLVSWQAISSRFPCPLHQIRTQGGSCLSAHLLPEAHICLQSAIRCL